MWGGTNSSASPHHSGSLKGRWVVRAASFACLLKVHLVALCQVLSFSELTQFSRACDLGNGILLLPVKQFQG